MCTGFGGKNVKFGEWLCFEMNMKVPLHVNEKGLRKEGKYGSSGGLPVRRV